MITYRELHTHPDADLFASVEEVKRFFKDIESLINPIRYSYFTPSNSPRVIEGYYINAPYYVNGEYTTIFEIISNDGWEYKNTYYQKDHKVLTFVKI